MRSQFGSFPKKEVCIYTHIYRKLFGESHKGKIILNYDQGVFKSAHTKGIVPPGSFSDQLVTRGSVCAYIATPRPSNVPASLIVSGI